MSVKAVREIDDARDNRGDDFESLEAKVYQTIELLKAAREARAAAERETQRVREQMREQAHEFEALRRELVGLRREREEVRARVEKMLNQIDGLTAAEGGR
ncbi:MAG TPA: hypothetical protein VFA60_02895 [Terriglobales bacterium]|nr:hypothetical protein [Terriglobales bacterium]